VTALRGARTHLDDVKVETRLLDEGKAEVKVIATLAGGGASIRMTGFDDPIDAKSDSGRSDRPEEVRRSSATLVGRVPEPLHDVARAQGRRRQHRKRSSRRSASAK
jgi:hypothetical protein